MFDVDIRQLGPLRIAGVRHVGPFTELGPSFQKIAGWAGANQLFGPSTRVLGVFHDDPQSTPAAELRSDAAVSVSGDVEGDPAQGIEISEVPGGVYGVGIWVGPYEQLPEVYAWLCQTWLPGSGHTYGEGPSYEIYLNDPTQVDASELQTAIHIPLKPNDG